MGPLLRERALGLDPEPVLAEERARSVGAEHTFDRDETDERRVEAMLLRLCEGVGARLREEALRGRCVHLKLRLAPFDTHTPQRTVAVCPKPALASASAALAPRRAAWSSRSRTTCRNWSSPWEKCESGIGALCTLGRETGSDIIAACSSVPGAPIHEPRCTDQQDATQKGGARAAGAR